MRPLVRNSLYAVIAVAILYAISYFFIDQQLASTFYAADLRHAAYIQHPYMTAFTDPYGWMVITSLGLIIFAVGYAQWPNAFNKNAFYFFVTVAIAIVITNGLKILLGRYRPDLLFQQNLYGFHFFTHEFLMNASPSGRATRIFAAATALSLIWKRASPIFFIIAIWFSFVRLVLTGHFFGDGLLGATVGILVAVWIKSLFFAQNR